MEDSLLKDLGISFSTGSTNSTDFHAVTQKSGISLFNPFCVQRDINGTVKEMPDMIFSFPVIPYGTKEPEIIAGYTRFRLPLLVKKSVNEVDKCWMVGWDGQFMVFNHGDINGQAVVKKRPVEINAHSKSLIHQVLQEMNQRYKKKWIQLRYNPFDQQSDIASAKDYEPMLAKVYYKPKMKNGVQLTYAKDGSPVFHNILKYGDVYIQPKADGTRADVTLGSTGEVIIRSRLGNEFKWLHELREELRVFCGYFPKGWRLDGELYHPQMTFNDIMRAVKTVLHEHETNSKIMYMIFDINDAVPDKAMIDCAKLAHPDGNIPSWNLRYPTEYRVAILKNAMERFSQDVGHPPRKFCVIPSYQVPNNKATLEYYMNYFCNGVQTPAPDGFSYTVKYEGIMIRKTAAGGYPRKETVYRNGRSCNLLKYKREMDAEGVIIGAFTEETASRDLMMFEMRMIDNLADFRKTIHLFTTTRPNALRDGTVKGLGYSFTLRPAADEQTRRQWWWAYANGQHMVFLGKVYTYKYQELTPDGKPRNPVGYRFYEEY